MLTAALLSLFHAPAFAVEVEFEGSYQLRGRLYDGLSLTRSTDAGIPERLTAYAEHRLWLRPRFLLSDEVRLTIDFKGLDNVRWGDRPDVPLSFTGLPTYEEGLSAPVSASDPTSPLLDFTVWRAWGEVDIKYGRVTFGRVPLNWGMGIWQNDGLGINAEYGDTADRVAFETLVQDSIFVRLAFDTHAENFVNTRDDTYAASLSAAYRSERVVGGIQVHYRHTDRTEGNDLDLVTVDLAAEAELGKLQLSAEGIGQFGGGDLEGGLNDVSITAFGGAVDARLDLQPWKLRVEAGLATGDKDETDARLKTFTFDRDHNVGVMLFEQPLPIFATAAPNEINNNRDFSQVISGNSIANAMYLKPSVSRALVEGFDLEAAYLMARVASRPDTGVDRGGYGSEVQAALRWTKLEHLELDARGALFLPGTFFRNAGDEVVDGFDRPTLGAQLTTRIRF
jgi:hypothetical protein